ncbi:nucleotidyltransferase domain-containing protein [candidate division KSB1 bacterium]|nr:nucleotidyltransferase domain-containing protein [candidate division KSB1 bacterium]
MPELDLNILQEALASESEILFAYLFGSYSTGEQTPVSDIDLAVYPSRKLTLDERLGIIQRLGKKTRHENLDVTFLDRLDNLDLFEAITDKGIVLADKDIDTREQFEVMMHHRYLDFKHWRDKIWNESA